MAGDETIIRDTIRSFRSHEVEALWGELDRPARHAYDQLWHGLHELGLTLLELPEHAGGQRIGPSATFEVVSELAAGCPALAVGLALHLSALATLFEACPDRELTAELAEALPSCRFVLLGAVLEPSPQTGFELRSNGALVLAGSGRVAQPYADWLALPALQGESLKLVLVRADAEGVHFEGLPSSHGLRLLPFGQLTFDGVTLAPEQVFEWPAGGRARNLADGLFASLLAGITRELGERAMRYALERYQGGKMIHEHDAVRLLVAPIVLATRALRALALDTLSDAQRAGDGGASAFGVELARRSGLDAIQTFGGYGYMEDYRVERYLRDANTIETFWVHAAAVQRRIAAQCFERMQS